MLPVLVIGRHAIRRRDWRLLQPLRFHGPAIAAIRHCAAVPAATTAEAKAEPKADEKKDDEKEKSMSWTGFGIRVGGAVTGIFFFYYWYKANWKLHQTEILILDRVRSLPFYSPPGPSLAERNTEIDPEGLRHDFVELFAEWFIATDLHEVGGVTRDDVLELLDELGFSETERPCKEFLMRGEGHLEERRRLAGAGLQEAITLIAILSRTPPPTEDDNASRFTRLTRSSEEKARIAQAAAASLPRIGQEAVDIMHRKILKRSPLMADASTLQAVLQFGPGQGPGATPQVTHSTGAAQAAATLPGPPLVPPPATLDAEPSGNIDEDQDRRFELARLLRIEDGLLAKLERQGSLSPAEEGRLRDVRDQRASL